MEEFFFGINQKMTIGSSYHIIFSLFGIAIQVLYVLLFRKSKDLTFKIVVAISWAIMVALEVGKEINWSYSSLYTRTYKGYNWAVFPFQFCSLPFYFFPLVIFLPESKFKDCLNVFLGTFMFVPAFGYYFYPSSLGIRVYINHQTMIHHILQGSVSLLIFVREFRKFTFKKFLLGSLFMVGTGLIAIALNYIIGTKVGTRINLWELTPIEEYYTTSPIYKDVLHATNYPIFVITFFLIFTSLSAAMYFVLMFIMKKATKNKQIPEQQIV